MSSPTPTISIPVDVMNPGQFFACCGLFELLLAALFPVPPDDFTEGTGFKVQVSLDRQAERAARRLKF